MSEFKYHTILTCPICGVMLDDICHKDPEPHGQSIAILGSDGRRFHGVNSPKCKNHPDWIKGWNTKTEEIK